MPVLAYKTTLSATLIYSLILKAFKLNTRKVLLSWIAVTMIATALMADWQSIGHDPCREGFPLNHSLAVSRTGSLDTTNNSHHYSTLEEVYVKESRACEDLSTSGSECFWNPKSRITGEYCAECFRVCRSVDKSLNFVQFSIGLTMLGMSLSPFQLNLVVMLSDVVPLKHQVTTL